MTFTNPDKNIEQFGLHEGDSIVIFGSGAGGHTFAAARALHGTGRVYAIDVRAHMLEKVARDSKMHKVNISTIQGNVERAGGTRLRDREIGAVIIPNTLFAYDDKKGVLAEAFRILKPGGRMLVIDWKGSFGNVGPQPEDVISEETVTELAQGVGFSFDRRINAGDQHFGLVFKRPAA